MKITIKTTEKKLSKSMINQMRRASIDTLRDGVSLGFMGGAIKTDWRTLLIETDGRYTTLSMNWKKNGEFGVSCRYIGDRHGSGRQKKFKTEAARDVWWECYQERVKEAEGAGQIYI